MLEDNTHCIVVELIPFILSIREFCISLDRLPVCGTLASALNETPGLVNEYGVAGLA